MARNRTWPVGYPHPPLREWPGVPPSCGENLRDAHVQDRQQEAGVGPGGARWNEAAEGAGQGRTHQGRGTTFFFTRNRLQRR